MLACLDAALAVDPLHATAHVNRGRALRQLGAPPEEQLACHDAMLAIVPLHATAPEERACYDSALAIDPLLAPAHYKRAVALRHLGAAQEEVLACLDATLAIDPLHAAAHANRGATLGAAPAEVIACYESALAIDPQHATAHASRGAKLQEIARWSEASAAVEAAIAADPTLGSGAHARMALGALGGSLLSRGRPHWSEHALVARLHARLGGGPHSTLGSELASRELHCRGSSSR